MKGRLFSLFLGVAFLQFLIAGIAYAHKMHLFASYEDGRIFTESYFSDGTPCRAARILAREDGGQVVAEGVTDQEGLFFFPYEGAGSLKISLNAGDGHGAEVTFQRDAGKNAEAVPEGPSGVERLPGPGGSVNVLEVRQVLKEELAPLRESVDRIRKKLERPTLDKVIGGLGWIVGLAGAYLWGVSRGGTMKKEGRREKDEGGRENPRDL